MAMGGGKCKAKGSLPGQTRSSTSRLNKEKRMGKSREVSEADVSGGGTISCHADVGERCRSALVVVGTYHSVMAGLVYRRGKFGLLFSVKRHVGCINTVIAGEKYMASGGTDERICLFTNKSHGSKIGSLNKNFQSDKMESSASTAAASSDGSSLSLRLADLGHVSSPSDARCMKFTSNAQFLLCGLADGQLVMYRTRDWSVASSLPLHEKGISHICLHPGRNKSDGEALAVTCSAEDRHVAVVDLMRGKLLSKWKFSASIPVDLCSDKNCGSMTAQSTLKNEVGHRPSKRAKWERHDEPHLLKFSPSGQYLGVLSSHAMVIYETATMGAVAFYCAVAPFQPQEELHVFCFLDDQTVLLGNESGQFLGLYGPWGGRIHKPQSVLTRVTSPVSTGDSSDQVKRGIERHPTQHRTRLKGLHYVRGTVFSIDAAGAVIAWHSHNGSLGDGVELHYVCSANCQGRVTAMDVLVL
ncbi:hypothetical protein TRVL_01419 [Trypanosoma vivax]|uniref:Uncharacterized protein n=1 Tax=Trypanosoma vivax (strain Y486) TaxID=1055687 RepID=G0TUX5_TRYVY|nr:hypothetical protein TRVL_01419 [Trypanosoma vivax]CCC47762.1 conserved hypothetical protein [Trypanosoma vivax Y486]